MDKDLFDVVGQLDDITMTQQWRPPLRLALSGILPPPALRVFEKGFDRKAIKYLRKSIERKRGKEDSYNIIPILTFKTSDSYERGSTNNGKSIFLSYSISVGNSCTIFTIHEAQRSVIRCVVQTAVPSLYPSHPPLSNPVLQRRRGFSAPQKQYQSTGLLFAISLTPTSNKYKSLETRQIALTQSHRPQGIQTTRSHNHE